MKLETEKLALMDLTETMKTLMSVTTYKIGTYTFDVEKRLLIHGSSSVKLTAKEAYLLVLFATNPSAILERKYILQTIWKEDNFRTSRSMDVYITKLRKYLSEDPALNIKNIHGAGFQLIVRDDE